MACCGQQGLLPAHHHACLPPWLEVVQVKAARCARGHRMGAENLGRYSDNFSTAASTYASTSFYDDLAWGAAWLFCATNDTTYLTVGHQSPSGFFFSSLMLISSESHVHHQPRSGFDLP